jgi:esterase/lipase superfamily enzyme
MSSPWRDFITALKSLLCPSRLLFILVIFVLFAIQVARSDDSGQSDVKIISSKNSTSETVLYYTLRNHNGEQTVDGYYGNLRDRPHTGLCEIKISPTGFEDLTSRLPFYVSDTVEQLETIKEFPERRLWQAFEHAAEDSASNKVVLYVHGYNINFVKGCSRSAMFQQTLDANSRLLLFSWPSDGALVSYTRDEADIEWSQQALETVIRKLLSIYGAERLNIVAHSLGARGVVRVLQLMARENDGKQVNELVLMAPDIDANVFRAAYPDLKKIIHRISLYSSEDDQPLRLSNEVHGYPRLGEAGENLVLLKGMDTIDVSISGGREMTGHLYHLYNDNVRTNIGRLLNHGETASMRPNMKKFKKDGLPYWMLLPVLEE